MKKAEIIEKLSAFPYDLRSFWIITGAAMVLYGLRDETGDIDMGCTTEAADRLERDFGILTRCGMHCAPAAHKALGTFPQGVVRFSVGAFTKETEIDEALNAVRVLAEER